MRNDINNYEKWYQQLWEMISTIMRNDINNYEKWYQQLWEMISTIMRNDVNNYEKWYQQLWEMISTIMRNDINRKTTFFWNRDRGREGTGIEILAGAWDPVEPCFLYSLLYLIPYLYLSYTLVIS